MNNDNYKKSDFFENIINKHPDILLRRYLKEILDKLSPRHLQALQKLHQESVNKYEKEKPDFTITEELKKIVNIINERVKNDMVSVPVLSFTVQKILKLLQDPSITFQKIEEEIKFEPAVCSRILAIANSAYYSQMKKTSTLFSAIVKLGLMELKRHLYNISGKQIFKAKNPKFDLLMNSVFIHSSASANAVFLICREKNIKDADSYITAALFHDIGKMFVTQVISELMDIKHISPQLPYESVIKIINFLHAKLGQGLLKLWDFDDKISDVALNHHMIYDPKDNFSGLIIAGDSIAKMCGYTELQSPRINTEIIKELGIDDDMLGLIITELKLFMKYFSQD